MASEWHTSFGRQAPGLELNIFTIIHLSSVNRGYTLRLGAGNRHNLPRFGALVPLTYPRVSGGLSGTLNISMGARRLG